MLIFQEIILPIARMDFPALLNILVDFADNKHEKTITQTIKYLRTPTTKSIIEKK